MTAINEAFTAIGGTIIASDCYSFGNGELSYDNFKGSEGHVRFIRNIKQNN